MPKCVLTLDQGTTGTTVMVLDQEGRLRGRAYAEIRQFYPRPGWVEHDPEEIYRSVVRLGREALKAARIRPADLAAIGITNQRETFLVWERASGRPLHRAIVWQCRRSAGICETLRADEDEITERTGLIIDPYFSGSKLKWLLDQDRSLRRRAARAEICFGTVDSWLIFKLSRGAEFVTDYTNASRTMLMNLERREWDATMLEILGVPIEMLPRIVGSRGPLAEAVSGTIADRPIPIGAVIGDQQSALFGQGCVHAGDTKVTYGTGAFLLTHTGSRRVRSRNRLIATAALGARGEPAMALEGSVFIAGAAIQWLRDELGLITKSADSLAIAQQSRVRAHPYVVPAFVGLGAPYWDSTARGAIFGITRGTNRADIVRATLDSIAYQVYDVIAAMGRDIGRRIRRLRVDGGAAANDYLMQFQADLIGGSLTRPQNAETTALGAGVLAGLAAAVWRSTDEVADLRAVDREFKPLISSRERAELISGWQDAVARVVQRPLSGPEPAKG
jgi:glycerol kinase